MNTLEKYVGRAVRLNKPIFTEMARRGTTAKEAPENLFLVAAVARGMHKLVCYGANMRITVGATDVVLA